MLNPVLRKHAEMIKDQQAGTGIAPIINFSFGREFADLIHGPMNAPAANTANPELPVYIPPPPAQNVNITPPIYTAPPAPALNAYNLACPTLLQVNRKAGIDLPLDAFCKHYELDDGIRDCFKEHRYKHAHMFHFLTIKDLETMMFMAGKIAEV